MTWISAEHVEAADALMQASGQRLYLAIGMSGEIYRDADQSHGTYQREFWGTVATELVSRME